MSGTYVATSSQYSTCASSLGFPRNLAGLTIMCWVTPGALINTETFVLYFSNNGSTSAGRASFSFRTSTTKFRLNGRRLTADTITSLDSVTNAVNGTRVHLAGTHSYTGTNMTLYINGVQDNTVTIAGWTANSQDADAGGCRIGTRADGSTGTFSNMVVDDIRCYQRVLTAQEINNIYVAKGGDSIVYGLYERWKFLGPTAGTQTTVPSIGSNQGGSVPSASPTFTESFATSRRRRRRS